MRKSYPILLGIIVFFTYLSGINSQFQFDDYPNIIQNERLHITSLTPENITKASLSGSSGILKRPISMMSFAINHYFSGLKPFNYKLTNILIHTINSISIYWFCLLLLNNFKSRFYFVNRDEIALSTSIAWGVHPINLTAVLYVVQRMTSLATLFTILSMGFYLKARQALKINNNVKFGIYLTITLLLALCGIFSKENAALIFIYLFIIECVLNREEEHTKHHKKTINTFFTIVLFIPIVALSAYTLVSPEWILKGYSVTSFTLYERVITEFRILWIYLYWILAPKNNSLGFFHDDIILSSSLLDSTLPIVAGIAHLILLFIIYYFWKKNIPVGSTLGFWDQF